MLVKPEKIITFGSLGDTADAALVAEITRLIIAISSKISSYCNRDFIYGLKSSEINYFGTDTVKLPTYPVYSVETSQIASSLKLSDLEDLDFIRIIDERKIYVETLMSSGIMVFTYYAGYVLPDYEGLVTPATPSNGQYWLDYASMILKQYDLDTTSWIDTAISPIPEELQEAVLEYIIWIRSRVKSKMVGTKERSRGYGYEGSTMVFERTIPTHVLDMLETLVNYD